MGFSGRTSTIVQVPGEASRDDTHPPCAPMTKREEHSLAKAAPLRYPPSTSPTVPLTFQPSFLVGPTPFPKCMGKDPTDLS